MGWLFLPCIGQQKTRHWGGLGGTKRGGEFAGQVARLRWRASNIRSRMARIDAAAKQMKAVTARFSTALEVRFATRAAEARSASGKDTGTVRFDEGDFTIVANLPKRVDWDQDRLAAMVERIRAAGDDPGEYVEISFKVPERNYVAWPEAIRQGFEPPRTVRTGTLKVEILPQGGVL